MGKVSGKDLELWFDGAEVPVESVNFSTQFDTLDGTDSATPGDGKDTEVSRATRSFTVDAKMYEPDGTEITSGTLTAGQRYKVTGGSITEGSNTYAVGQIFESDGTGTATTTNKVVPLGSRITGKDMAFTFNGSSVPVTDIDFNLSYDELDGTDSDTTGDAKETEVSRAERETAITGIVRDTAADLLTTSPVKKAATLEFSTTTKVAGYIIPISKSIVDNVNDLVKIDYSFKWVGAPTETNMGLPAGVVKPIKIILKRGSTTNKEYTGNAVITKKSAKSNIAGMATINYTFSINGALAENVAN